jgi:exodeoxyribonuclease-3
MLDARYVDGYRSLFADEKGYTFPTWDPHLRLDYIFLPARFADRLKNSQVIKEPAEVALASDHFPLVAYLDIS